MSTMSEVTLASVLNDFRDALKQYEAALLQPSSQDSIYAWRNGLGIVKSNTTPPTYGVCGAMYATALPAGVTFTNGAREKALYVRRETALGWCIDNTHKVIENLQAKHQPEVK